MSDTLKNLYADANIPHRYYDNVTPVDLYRGQKLREFKQGKGILDPELVGWVKPDGSHRLADVLVEEVDGRMIVRGCRSIAGHYRGVSVFDRVPPFSKSSSWKCFLIPSESKIPEALAITKDADFRRGSSGIHFTIAPKDDMPLDLFLVWLRSFVETARELT